MSSKVFLNLAMLSIVLAACSQGGQGDYYIGPPQPASDSDCQEMQKVMEVVNNTLLEKADSLMEGSMTVECGTKNIVMNYSVLRDSPVNVGVLEEDIAFNLTQLTCNNASFQRIIRMGWSVENSVRFKDGYEKSFRAWC